MLAQISYKKSTAISMLIQVIKKAEDTAKAWKNCQFYNICEKKELGAICSQ